MNRSTTMQQPTTTLAEDRNQQSAGISFAHETAAMSIKKSVEGFRCAPLVKVYAVFRTSILTAALWLIAVSSTQAIAQPPAPQLRKPSAFDPPLVTEESYERAQSLPRAEIEAYLRPERIANDYRQRILAAEDIFRGRVAALRPTRPSNLPMHSYYAPYSVPRRIIYVPSFVD